MHTALTEAPAAWAPTHRLFIVNDENRWERRRALRVLRGVGNRVLMSPSSGVRENTIGGCVSRSTPIFFWCCEPVWERGGGGRTVSRPFAGTVDCCFEHV